MKLFLIVSISSAVKSVVPPSFLNAINKYLTSEGITLDAVSHFFIVNTWSLWFAFVSVLFANAIVE